jgi:hypothetical protein
MACSFFRPNFEPWPIIWVHLGSSAYFAGRHRQPFAIFDLPNNCLAFQAGRSDPCDDRAERGTKENDYDDLYD